MNRLGSNFDGPQMNVAAPSGMRYFDLYHGTELKPETVGSDTVLSFPIEANGFGAVLATPGEPSDTIKKLMQHMATLAGKSLASYSHEWTVLPQTMTEIPPTEPAVASSLRHGAYPRRGFCLQGAWY